MTPAALRFRGSACQRRWECQGNLVYICIVLEAEAPLPCSPSSAPPPQLHCSGSFGEAVFSAAPFALDGSGSAFLL